MAAPAIFGALIKGGNRRDMFIACLFSAGLMIFAAISWRSSSA
ncbi:MAG TPA: hypothetical protein VEZ19_02120 [Rubrobacter sp.]|nr:hypothetical protein [Rubrobacter sp.]